MLLLLGLTLALGACTAGGTRAPNSAGVAQPTPTLTSTPARRAVVTPTRMSARSATATPTPTSTGRASATPTVVLSGLPTIQYDRLPTQARETIALIQRGGPFPYRQDGAVFQNRERLLPGKPGGYYHEYTVMTPGSSNRGARRIVTGAKDELYYTDDHYDSFKQVIMP